MLTIGNVIIPSQVLLAPMAGVTDLPYRMINRRFGCPFAFTEMVNARALAHGNRKTLTLLDTEERDTPLGVQLFGSDEKFLRKALEALAGHPATIVDFNSACPMKKIIGNREGAALMNDLPLLERLLRTLVEHAGRPVTVKLRAGWTAASRNAVEAARRAEQAGVRAIFIHGRTRDQFYAGTVDYGIIRDVKRSVSVPVIGSGDVFDASAAKRMLDETGCDGVLIARGSYGNPWIWREIERYFTDGTLPPPPSVDERIAVMREHLSQVVACFGREPGVFIFRKLFVWYTKGFSQVKDLRRRVFNLTDPGEIERTILEFSGRLV